MTDMARSTVFETNSQGHAGNPPGHGPYMKIFLTIVDNRIAHARHETYPCPACEKCGTALCNMITGLSTEQAWKINSAELHCEVGEIRRSKWSCLELAIRAMEDALSHYEESL